MVIWQRGECGTQVRPPGDGIFGDREVDVSILCQEMNAIYERLREVAVRRNGERKESLSVIYLKTDTFLALSCCFFNWFSVACK